jgi:hypothetical protein
MRVQKANNINSTEQIATDGSPRGWHLNEKHVLVDGGPCPARFFDFEHIFSTMSAGS